MTGESCFEWVFCWITLSMDVICDWGLVVYFREDDVAVAADIKKQICAEALHVLSSLADLSNAVHWMPPGFLWAGRFPHWLVGLMGTFSSLVGMLQMCFSEESASVWDHRLCVSKCVAFTLQWGCIGLRSFSALAVTETISVPSAEVM